MKKKKKTVNRFVVGYPGYGNDVYGEDNEWGMVRSAQPFPSLAEAQKHKRNNEMVIYRLVRVPKNKCKKPK